jgi:CxxC motif-containing protein (DUF1111 family)
MKQLLGYLVGAVLLFTPVGLRVLTRSEPEPPPLDPADVAAGKVLFTHEFSANDPLCGDGDGLGPVFNAKSCVACHDQGGLGGSGARKHNVTVFFKPSGPQGKPEQGVIHAAATAPRYQESLTNAHPQLPGLTQPTLEQLKELQGQGQFGFGVEVSQRNTPALFGARLIDEMPERVILAEERAQKVRWHAAGGEHAPIGRALRLPDGRVGRFGWKAQSASLLDFVQAACANELGLDNPGQAQPKPLAFPGYNSKGIDLTRQQCEQMTAFLAALPRPVERAPSPRVQESVERGRHAFNAIGCAECHTPSLGSVEGLYSDLLLHRMGMELVGGGSYNSPPPGVPDSPGSSPQPDEWRTPPLWGVADSAPYLHDGRAATLEEAIAQHSGQAHESARRFSQLPAAQQQEVIYFLKSLRAPG